MFPIDISYPDFDPSEAVSQAIQEKAEKLERYYTPITDCEVVVAAPHQHKEKGKIYHVRINLRVPGHELVVNRESEQNHAHEDVYVAIRDAFDAMSRQLEKLHDKRRENPKHHEAPPTGRVVKVFPAEGYGFLQSDDGREVYFHRNSVVGFNFDKIQVDMKVRFSEEMGENGPQATSMTVVG